MKYPRMHHLPWSPEPTRDDKILKDVKSFLGIKLIITEKMDGSNVCMEHEGCFSRSHAGPPDHPSFNAFKALHATVKDKIGENTQVFGEWCFAQHSIFYDRLPQYFLLFGIRVGEIWLNWEGTKGYAIKLGVPTVPLLASVEVHTSDDLKRIVEGFANGPSVYGEEREGVVVRASEGFKDEEFATKVAKWVRKNHVKTDEHWKHQKIVKNKLVDRFLHFRKTKED
jgi:hypothetical protein